MNYFKNENNQIFAYDNEQIKLGYGSDLVAITEAEKDKLLAPSAEELETQAKQQAEQIKTEALAKLTVTTESGKVFYADTEARVDIESAIRVGELTSQDSTVWKLAEEFEGSRYAQVTIDELREASMLALLAKGSIVGAVQTQGDE